VALNFHEFIASCGLERLARGLQVLWLGEEGGYLSEHEEDDMKYRWLMVGSIVASFVLIAALGFAAERSAGARVAPSNVTRIQVAPPPTGMSALPEARPLPSTEIMNVMPSCIDGYIVSRGDPGQDFGDPCLSKGGYYCKYNGPEPSRDACRQWGLRTKRDNQDNYTCWNENDNFNSEYKGDGTCIDESFKRLDFGLSGFKCTRTNGLRASPCLRSLTNMGIVFYDAAGDWNVCCMPANP
jgi:hypothetical protein